MAKRDTTKRTTPGTAKKKVAKAKAKVKAKPQRVSGRASADRSFAKVLQSKSVDTILPDVANRLEAGRRLYAKESVAAATAELAILNQECERLIKEGEGKLPAQARIRRLVAAVETDIQGGNALLDEMKQAIVPERGGWSVMGRVTGRDGSVARQTEIVFLDQNNELIKQLRPIKVGVDGTARRTFSADVIGRLLTKGVKIKAAVRVGGRIVATDALAVSPKADALHQFDFRVDKGLS